MSSLQSIQKEFKQNILKDYLLGMDMQEIATKYGFKNIRTCYYHIEPLTQKQKLEHMFNKAKRMQSELQEERV